jgi:putative membrane protein
VITFTDSHSHQANFDPNRSERFKNDMAYLMIAWVHALRMHLRRQENWSELAAYLSKPDFDQLSGSQNKPNYLQLMMGRKIYQAMADGTLGGFDSFQMEGQLLALANYQGGCERIKYTPLPRQYDFFTRVFVLVFAFLLPFGLLGLFANSPSVDWLLIPISVIVSGVFVVLEKTGAANEDPFENLITDVPMTALCNTIERDLREMLGENELPRPLRPENGYLY